MDNAKEQGVCPPFLVLGTISRKQTRSSPIERKRSANTNQTQGIAAEAHTHHDRGCKLLPGDVFLGRSSILYRRDDHRGARNIRVRGCVQSVPSHAPSAEPGSAACWNGLDQSYHRLVRPALSVGGLRIAGKSPCCDALVWLLDGRACGVVQLDRDQGGANGQGAWAQANILRIYRLTVCRIAVQQFCPTTRSPRPAYGASIWVRGYGRLAHAVRSGMRVGNRYIRLFRR